MKKTYQGFTLVEIMVAVVIIAMLTAIIFVSINRARLRTRDTIIISQLEQVQALGETVYNPETGYKELHDMKIGNYSTLKGIEDRITEIGRVLVIKFPYEFSEQEMGEHGFESYCAYIPLVGNRREDYCVDSRGVALKLDRDKGDHHCRTDERPFICEYIQ